MDNLYRSDPPVALLQGTVHNREHKIAPPEPEHALSLVILPLEITNRLFAIHFAHCASTFLLPSAELYALQPQAYFMATRLLQGHCQDLNHQTLSFAGDTGIA
jgi:hypothetical protein